MPAAQEGPLEPVADRRRRRPPERFHVFVSYTTREDETRELKPAVDYFLEHMLRPAIETTIGEPPVFYDGYSLYRQRGFSNRTDRELESLLTFAIEESEVLIAFVSPAYLTSRWCLFECRAMVEKVLRPWCDVCRVPPGRDLQDTRNPPLRPTTFECLAGRLLTLLWRLRRQPGRPGGDIVVVSWMELPALAKHGVATMDWRSCSTAVERWKPIVLHRERHGSVSPTWIAGARELDANCLEAMAATAHLVVQILEGRRRAYAKTTMWHPVPDYQANGGGSHPLLDEWRATEE